jgi:hypothetical protein
MPDDERWQRRLLAYSGVRAAGLAVFFLGLAIIYTDLLREGGWPQVGAVVWILGVIDALFAPMLLRKAWAEKDRPERQRNASGRM